MKKTTSKIFSSKVSMDEGMRTHLLACYRNHLVIYNDIVDLHRKYRYKTYKEMKEVLVNMLTSKGVKPIIRNALNNEIYYLFKKADFKHKLITDIQYISAITGSDYRNHTLIYDAKKLTLGVLDVESKMHLDKPLPIVQGCDNLYLNLSYSCSDDMFEVSVFATVEAFA